MSRTLVGIVCLLCLSVVAAYAQTPVRNPTTVTFNCADHDRDDEHELDIIRKSDGVVIATILLGDPAADANGLVVAKINVQPIDFNVYYTVMRAVANGIKSDNSEASNTFERSPGRPGSVSVK